MELFKHKNHRNQHYMNWLKKQKCVVSKKKAQVAHHIRLSTNGGQGIKPSDYFCTPLLNCYHTGGRWAVHNIGEETFLKHFNLSKEKIFIHYLSIYLKTFYKINIDTQSSSQNEIIAKLIDKIEKNKPEEEKVVKIKAPSVTESEFYQQAKEAKNLRDKETRKMLKANALENIKIQAPKASETDYYQQAKEAKNLRDKETRRLLKEEATENVKAQAPKTSDTDFYQQAKEAKREYDRKMRDQNKAKQSEYRKAQYRRLKELKK